MGRRGHRRRRRELRRHGGDRPAVHRPRVRPAVARLHRAEELRGVAGQPRLDLLAGRGRAGDAGPGRRDQGDAGGRPGMRRLPHAARQPLSRPLDPVDRLVPRLPAAPLRPAQGEMGRAVRPRVRAGRGRGRPAARGTRAPSVPRRLAPPADHRSVLEPGGAADVRGRPAHRSAANRAPRRRGVSQELRPARRNQGRRARPHRVAAQLVLRGDEVREALGAMFTPPHRHRPHLARGTEPGPPDGARSPGARPPHRARGAPGRRTGPPRERGPRSHPAGPGP